MSQPTEKKIRLLVVDDHALFRDGLVRLLESEPDIEVVAACSTVNEALAALSGGEIDLVLLDYDLGSETGARFLLRSAEMGFRGRVLVVTAGLSDSESTTLLRYGATGIFPKHSPPDLLGKAIRKVVQGEVWLDQRYLQALIQEAKSAGPEDRPRRLSERERQVLRAVFEGASNKEIAVRLQVSESSVKATLQQLFLKTGVRTRSQLVRVALEQYRDYL